MEEIRGKFRKKRIKTEVKRGGDQSTDAGFIGIR